jgi:hypothetical protein
MWQLHAAKLRHQSGNLEIVKDVVNACALSSTLLCFFQIQNNARLQAFTSGSENWATIYLGPTGRLPGDRRNTQHTTRQQERSPNAPPSAECLSLEALIYRQVSDNPPDEKTPPNSTIAMPRSCRSRLIVPFLCAMLSLVRAGLLHWRQLTPRGIGTVAR